MLAFSKLNSPSLLPSSSNPPHHHRHRHRHPPPPSSIKPHSTSSPVSLKSTFLRQIKPILTTACIIAAAAALSSSRLPFTPPPAAAVVSQQTKHNNNKRNSQSEEVDALTELLNSKLSSRDMNETEWIVDRLLELEPRQKQWRVLKAHILINKGEIDTAGGELEEMVEEDPFFVEAYHGMVLVQSHRGVGMEDLVQRIERVMEICRREGRAEGVKDFKLLVAQISLFGGRYDEALMVYDELGRENSDDFRPYVCRGIVYSLMGKGEEARKEFLKYKELVPFDHPFNNLFNENMVLDNVFGGGGGGMMMNKKN